MRRIGTLLSLAGLALVATAQNDPQNDRQGCQSGAGASRTRANACGDDDTTVESAEIEFTLTLDRPTFEFSQCQANLTIDYVQINTIASVNGVIENEDCGASNGEYTIRARIRDHNGETKTLDFPESWQRSDDRPVTFSTEYPIGANVELLRVRSSGLRCECAEPDEAEPAPVQ